MCSRSCVHKAIFGAIVKGEYMKFTILALVYTIFSFSAKGQSFYEIEWNADEVTYTALVVYYEQTHIDVRVKYSENGVYKVAKYGCEGSYFTDDAGTRFFIFDGSDAQIVYEAEATNNGYHADNFIFTHLNDDNEFLDLYTIDDYDLERDDFDVGMVEASFKQLDPQTHFNEQYIFDFFDKHEPEYSWYLSLVPGHNTNTTTTTNNQPATMHLFFVADSKDRSIGPSTQKDMNDVTTTFEKIARELEIESKVYTNYGDQFSKSHMFQTIDNIQCGENDVLLFFYSGHGYNETSQSSTFPTMSLDGPDFSLEDIYAELEKKGARLTLVLGDLCNSIPQTKSPIASAGNIPFKSGYLFDRAKLERLFLESEGSMISSSSKKGQWSFCMSQPNGQLGNGHFTNAFIESLVKETSKVSPETGDWESVLVRAYSTAKNGTHSITNQNGTKGQDGQGLISIKY